MREPSIGEKNGSEGASSRDSRRHKRGSLKARVLELEEALEKAKAESDGNYDNWLRARAEFENLKKRTLREIEQAHRSAGEKLVLELLPVMDDLEKAIEASRASEELKPMEEGLSLIRKGLQDALRACGVRAIDPVGEAFDPSAHDAVMQMPDDDAEPGTILRVLQKGYLMNGFPLRPAKVVVAGVDAAAADGEPGTGEVAGEATTGLPGAPDWTDDSGREEE